jgi:hypothetical protein
MLVITKLGTLEVETCAFIVETSTFLVETCVVTRDHNWYLTVCGASTLISKFKKHVIEHPSQGVHLRVS